MRRVRAGRRIIRLITFWVSLDCDSIFYVFVFGFILVATDGAEMRICGLGVDRMAVRLEQLC